MAARVTRIAAPTATNLRLTVTPGVPRVPTTTHVATTAGTSRARSRARSPPPGLRIDAAGGAADASGRALRRDPSSTSIDQAHRGQIGYRRQRGLFGRRSQ